MAKQIKAIKCPQCGSTQNTEIKADFYRCNSCGTEYYLDNDDVNINYNYRYQPSQPAAPVVAKPNKKAAGLILGIFLIFFVITFVISFNNNSSKSIRGVNSTNTLSSEPTYSLWHSDMSMFNRNGNGQPVILLIGERNYYEGKGQNGYYLSFYNAESKKELNSTLLQAAATSSASADIKIHNFSNGDVYFTINKNKIYKIDKGNLTAADVTISLFKTQAELQSGIATIEFMYDNYGDGLSLLTNDGKSFSYYPRVDKLYSKDDLYAAGNGFANLLPGAVQKSYFTFTNKGFDYPDEKVQLLKIIYKDNNGGAMDKLESPSWSKDFGGSGIFTDADPYEKILIGKRMMEHARILSFKDITPGRLYFNPEVLWNDDKTVLIVSKANAAPNAAPNLQSLDANTGTVKWTTPLNDMSPKTAMSFSGGFVLADYTSIAVVNSNGTITNQYKLN